MSNLLLVPSLRKLVVTGIAINIGGLTESLVRHATDSFSELLSSLPTNYDDDTVITTPHDIIYAIREVFEANQGVERITIPLMETLDIYLSQGYLVAVTDCVPVKAIFNLLKKEVFKTKNTKKLLVGIKVFAGFASLADPDQPEGFTIVQKLAIEKLVLYLCHPYPIVRFSANNRYEPHLLKLYIYLYLR